MSSSKNLENFAIPLEEIHLATQNFSSENRIGDGGFGMVYKGKLSERWQNRTAAIKRLNRAGYQGEHEFFNELELVSSCHHHNIIPFIGYCNEGDEMIIVFEYAVKGSLETHLQKRNKRRCLTWEQRLKICLGTARGLQYLHSGGDHFKSIIHRDLKSANILLDENLEAKICDFGLSRSIQRNDPNSKFYTKVAGTKVYIDPAYERSGKLSKEADVYSFGIVMLELMTGMLAHHERRIEDKEQKIMISLVLEYQGNRAYKITDPYIRDEIDDEFFMTFYELANECVNMDPRQRPTMDTIITKTEEYLQEVQLRREQQELVAERMEAFAHLEKLADKVTQERHNLHELLKQRHSIQSSFTVTNTKVPANEGESSNNPNEEGASDSKSKKKWFNLNLKGSSDKKSG